MCIPHVQDSFCRIFLTQRQQKIRQELRNVPLGMHGILADRERGLCGDEERSGIRTGGNAEHVRTSEDLQPEPAGADAQHQSGI